MNNITKLANKIKHTEKPFGSWTLGEVVRCEPLKIALYGGEIMAGIDDILKITSALSGCKWQCGEIVLCLVSKTKIIAVDKVVE